LHAFWTTNNVLCIIISIYLTQDLYILMGKQNIDNASNSKKYTFRSLFIKIIQISDERRLKNTTTIMTEKLNPTYRHVKHHWYPTTCSNLFHNLLYIYPLCGSWVKKLSYVWFFLCKWSSFCIDLQWIFIAMFPFTNKNQ
jgi:hypothetical protein